MSNKTSVFGPDNFHAELVDGMVVIKIDPNIVIARVGDLKKDGTPYKSTMVSSSRGAFPIGGVRVSLNVML